MHTKQARSGILVANHAAVAFLITLLCCAAARSSVAQNASRARNQPTPRASTTSSGAIPQAIMLTITRAEDERRWDARLAALLSNRSAAVRRRAALAAGRIGDEKAVGALTAVLRNDADVGARETAAFALGETESASATDALVEVVQGAQGAGELRALAVEALGKVAAALPPTDQARRDAIGAAILVALDRERGAGASGENLNVVLAGLTAALRARPANASRAIKPFLASPDARVRADAANALARLRAKDANDELRRLLNDADPVARANAARALGAAEDKASFNELLGRATSDPDARVRVSAVRALAALKDARSVAPLFRRFDELFTSYRAGKAGRVEHPPEINELLEIASALSSALANTGDEKAITLITLLRSGENVFAPELEIAYARIAPAAYLRDPVVSEVLLHGANVPHANGDWRPLASVAQGLSEAARQTSEAKGNDAAASLRADTVIRLRAVVNHPGAPAVALPEVLNALALFKPDDLDATLRKQLAADDFYVRNDFYVRATAATLLGELPASEGNTSALVAALPRALNDTANDAALATLDALAKQKNARAIEAMKTSLNSKDHLVRRRAASLLKSLGAGDYSSRAGTVATRNTAADYERALARRGKLVRAVVVTDKGEFTIELLPDDAPLTVDNFINLAQSKFFDRTTFHRVVPNFVIQGGDPRGDGNGGPPYQIRCEINRVTYGRGAVGMALSGKDTGGSQWFVTHSPQPHLNGGYTVFGRVTEGMDVVDRIARGDRILRVSVVEGRRAPARTGANQRSR